MADNNGQYSNVPQELKALPRWVCFCVVWNESRNKYNKPPISPHTLKNGSSTNSSSWGSYEKAVEQVGKPCAYYDEATGATVQATVAGIGFAFEGSGYFGVDLDHVRNEAGEITQEAQQIIKELDAYTEISPSKTGLHVLCKGTIPAGRRKVKNADGTDYEMYSSGRYFTVTGDIFGSQKSAAERTEQAAAVHKRYFEERTKPKEPRRSTAPAADTSADAWKYWRENMERNADFAALWNGARRGDDESRSDYAFMCELAKRFNRNTGLMIEAFRQSPYAQQKQGIHYKKTFTRSDYMERTAAEAAAACAETDAERREAYLREKRGGSMEDRRIQTTHTDNADIQAAAPAEPKKAARLAPLSVGLYLKEKLREDIEKFAPYRDKKTGFPDLDAAAGGLYPGVYLLGAISSLGKTTFILQIADQLAEQGEHILFFSLEQSMFELASKSLARITRQQDREQALNSLEIRKGRFLQDDDQKAIVNRAYTEYQRRTGGRVSVIDGTFDVTMAGISQCVEDYISKTGVKPIVIIDYLQALQPEEERQHNDIRMNVDKNVQAIKRMSGERELTIFVISSLNRSNYLTPVDFESFKESGGIEYTADVVWGLQLKVMNEALFDKKDKIKAQREAVKEAKAKDPRQIELVCLKNRYGKSSYSVGFNYEPAFDLFTQSYDYDDLPFTELDRKRK